MGYVAAVGLVPLPVAVQDPQPVFDNVRLVEFTGRQWLIDQVDRFLTEQACGFVVIQAEAGLGKTALAARLVQQREYLSHFTHLGGTSATVALRNLSAQLITRFGIQRLASESVVPAWTQTTDGFTTLLNQVAEIATSVGKRIVVVVDGLDEAEPVETGLPLGLPAVLPEGVFVIATCRPGTTLPVESPTLWLSVTPDQPENTTDIHQFLRRTAQEPTIAARLAEAGVSAEEFAVTLTQRCGGVWVYLRYILDEIRLGHRDVTDLNDLPKDLTDYYTKALRAGQTDQQWEHVGLPVWATLAAAQEPLPLDAITRLSGSLNPQAVRRLCDSRYRPFLTVTDTQPRRYAIYHASLREYLIGRLPSRTHLDDVCALTDQLTDAVKRAHVRIADWYLTLFGGLPYLNALATDPSMARQDNGYPLRHLVTHLEHAGRIDDLHALLTCEHPTGTGQAYNVWYQAHDHAGTLPNYLADITRAQAYARAATDRYLATGQVTPHLGLELLYTLITASLTSLISYIPTNLVLRLVEAGIWTPQRALSHVFLLSEDDRVKALVALAPHLPPHLIPQALRAIAVTITYSSTRGRALEGLADHLLPDLIPQALEIITTVSNDPYSARALVALAPHLRPHLIPQALQVATSITDDYDRARALTALAPHLPPDQRHTTLHQALQTATSITDTRVRADVLAGLAPRLPPDLIPQAHHVATTVTSDHYRAWALAVLASHLPPDQRHTTLHQALHVATSITNGSERSWALVHLAPYLPPDLIPSLLHAAITIADEPRTWALEGLARYLPPALIPQALQSATTIADDHYRSRALAALAPHLPPHLIPQALQVATGITSASERVRALAALAPHLPHDQRRSTLHLALHVATTITTYHARAWALAALAPHLPPDLIPQAHQVATSIIEKSAHAEALTALAKHLPPDLIPDDLHTVAIAEEPVRIKVLPASTGPAPYDIPYGLFSHIPRTATTIANIYDRIRALRDFLIKTSQEELAAHIQQASDSVTLDFDGLELFAHCIKTSPHDPHGLTTIARFLATGSHRSTVLNLLATAAPVISRYGGAAAVRYCLDAVRTVCRWWP